MVSPYKSILDEIGEGGEVIIDRANAESLNGTIKDVSDFGCTVKKPVSEKIEDCEKYLLVFVAFEDMRGVGKIDWNMDVIGH